MNTPPRRMRFRDWPPRRIAWMWLIGGALQALALAIVPPLLGWEAADPADFTMDTSGADSAALSAPVAAQDTLPPSIALIRTEVAPGDTLVRVEMDTSWLQYRTTGGPVEMSPDLQQTATQIGNTLAPMIVAMGRAVVQVLLLVFTIPAILVAATLAWLILRLLPSRRPVDPNA